MNNLSKRSLTQNFRGQMVPMKRFPFSSMSVVTIERYPNIAATKPLEETIGPPGVGREPEYFSTISPLTTKFKPSSSLVLGLPICLKIKKGSHQLDH